MAETIVGVRNLKAELSSHLRRVKTGDTVLITERGNPIGRIVPAGTSVEERMKKMVAAGLASWSGQRLQPIKPPAKVRGKRSLADLLLEDRE